MSTDSIKGLTTARLTRRDVMSYAWWAALGLLGLEGGAATAKFLWPPPKAGAFGGKFALPLDSLPQEIGSIDATYLNTGRLYLSRLPSGILVMYRKCTHLGCVVPWRADERSEDELALTGRFNCPCHGSIFDRYGLVHAGPAPRPLDLFAASIQDGLLVVDTGTVIQRSSFDGAQVVKISMAKVGGY